MNELEQQIIFTELLKRHDLVQVPMIQRDYAQGREEQKEIRDAFLDALRKALTLPPDDSTLPLNLDFIYGSVEGQEPKCFQPLDGQQRLTTLFLLHWYLAWQDGRTQEFQEIFVEEDKSRFSYAVRQSAKEFYDELVRFQPDNSLDSCETISSILTDQPWYYRSWRLDPTIQSSLEALDAIHKRFKSSSPDGLYTRITNADHPAITFQLLDLENFGLSDDLYIKMNARGKPLTSFETFKARYEQELRTQFEGETVLLDGRSVPLAEYFSKRIDTTWADFFWTYRNTETNLYDDAVINFFRVVALLSRDPESDTYLDDVKVFRDRSEKSSFSLFRNNGWLDREFYKVLALLLEAWSDEGVDFKTYLPNDQYFGEVSLFQKVIKEPTELSFAEIVQFVGYIVFMREHRDSPEQDTFQEWMRIVFNLSGNTPYDRPQMQRSISALNEMAQHSGNVLQFFADTEKLTAGFNQQQVREEKLKAELIIADPNWKVLINRAENHGYFKGQIEFLLDFCEALTKSHKLSCNQWDKDTHAQLQNKFKNYLGKAEVMFSSNGLRTSSARWERALLSIGDYLLPIGRNYSFLTPRGTGPVSWKRLLRGGETEPQKRNLLKELLDRLTDTGSLEEQLDEIIESATDLPAWRRAFIKQDRAFFYCRRREIRRQSEDMIYLLRKSQMNGAHAELFTYCLYYDELILRKASWLPLKLKEYYEPYGIGDEPGIRFSWKHGQNEVHFKIEWNGRNFIIYVRKDELSGLSEVENALCKIGFDESEQKLQRDCDSSKDILDVLSGLRVLLDHYEVGS